jgi:hypothetical protein
MGQATHGQGYAVGALEIYFVHAGTVEFRDGPPGAAPS